MPDFDELCADLRAWAEGDRINTAAVERLIANARMITEAFAMALGGAR